MYNNVSSFENTVESPISRTITNTPRKGYQKNPDFGFKNELIHDLRRDDSDPKNWQLMY